jgi:hypothetical protein
MLRINVGNWSQPFAGCSIQLENSGVLNLKREMKRGKGFGGRTFEAYSEMYLKTKSSCIFDVRS